MDGLWTDGYPLDGLAVGNIKNKTKISPAILGLRLSLTKSMLLPIKVKESCFVIFSILLNNKISAECQLVWNTDLIVAQLDRFRYGQLLEGYSNPSV